jgi:hypothetical protein
MRVHDGSGDRRVHERMLSELRLDMPEFN